MCDTERSLEIHLVSVLETCLAVVLATIITRVSDFLGYHFSRWYYYRLPHGDELSEELTT